MATPAPLQALKGYDTDHNRSKNKQGVQFRTNVPDSAGMVQASILDHDAGIEINEFDLAP